MITLLTLYVETADILQDAPVFDLQRILENKPHTEAFLHHYLNLALSQFMGWATGRAWDYHVRFVVIGYGTQPTTDDHQSASSSQRLTQSIAKEATMYYLTSMQTGNGKTLTVINGKTYNLIRHYAFSSVGSFFFIVSGVTPLKDDDIAEHWKVIRQGNVFVALSARYFSYHLLKEGASGPDNWPNFKTPPDYFAFVGPTAEAARAQIRDVIAQFAPQHLELVPYIIDNGYRIKDRVTTGEPFAYLIKTGDLK